MICGHGHKQIFKNPYPRDSRIIQMPYFRAKAIDQIPALCPPPLPVRRLDIDRCINKLPAKYALQLHQKGNRTLILQPERSKN